MIIGEQISLDSLKIRIPLSRCTVLDERLTQKYVFVGDKFGDIDETVVKKNSLTIPSYHYNTRYFIQNQGNGETKQDYVIILLSAKILEQKYFEGITEHNISEIYKKLIAQKVVLFSEEDFLHSGNSTDVDFKFDFALMEGMKGEPIKMFNILLKQLEALTLPKYSEITDRFPKRKTEGIKSQGIMWNTRTSATESKPFVKFYNKKIQIAQSGLGSKKGMREYAEAFLTTQERQAVRYRVEVTVKNKKAFKRLKIKGNSLYHLLKLTPTEKQNIITSSIKHYLVDMNPKPIVKLNKNEYWYIGTIINLMNGLQLQELPKDYIISLAIANFNKDQKHRYLPLLKAKYDEFISKEKPIDYNLDVSGWFSLLGLRK